VHFFIDEAGDFAIPRDASEHRVAVAAGLAFTDSAWATARAWFADFKRALSSTELVRGEPNWYSMSSANRVAFCEGLSRADGVSFTPVTLDLSHLAPNADELLAPMLAKLDAQADLMVYESAKRDLRELAKQAHNLSGVQQLRIYAWAYCLHQSLYHAIIFQSHGAKAASWQQVSIEIDPVQPKPRSREQRVFSLMVLAWLVGWSQGQPFITVEGVHTPEHPFVRNFDTPSGIDFGRLVRPNLQWERSHKSLGIQLADLCAAVVHQAATDLDRGSESFDLFVKLMRLSPYGWKRGPGLFSPATIPPAHLEEKYLVLADAMRSR
jgi:hypothetical protein